MIVIGALPSRATVLAQGVAAATLCCLLGVALAAGSVSPLLVAGVAFAAAAAPVGVVALARIADERAVGGLVLLALGVGDAVVVHHSPDVSLLELFSLGPALLLLLQRLPRVGIGVAGRGFVLLFVLSAVGLVALGALYVLYPPTGLGRGAPAKELAKNLEIFLVAAAVFAYVDGQKRFARLYGLLVGIAVAGTFSSLVTTHGHLFSSKSLQNGSALAVIALALPFSRNRSVATLLAASFVLLVVSRTRGAWIELLVIALVVLASRRFRGSLGRRALRILTAATIGLVLSVALIPSLSARVASITAGSDQSVHDRAAMTRAALIEMRDYPLTGVGPGEFKPWLLESPPVVTFQIGVQNIPKDPHDSFAKFAGEMGLPGLALFCALMAAVLGPTWRFRRMLLAFPAFRPYAIGTSFYAILFLLARLTSEWATLDRLGIGFAAGLLLAITRIVDAERRRSAAAKD